MPCGAKYATRVIHDRTRLHETQKRRVALRKDTNVDTKTKPDPQADQREDVKILAAATRGAIDRYFELFLDQLDRMNRWLLQAERWAETGGTLPSAVRRYERLAKLAYDTPSECHQCERCERCRAQQVLSSLSLLGFDTPLMHVFDLMTGRSRDLDGALQQLEATFMELTCNGLVTELIMAHAFARAGYAPHARSNRKKRTSTVAACSPGVHQGPDAGVHAPVLRLVQGGRSKRRAGPRAAAKRR